MYRKTIRAALAFVTILINGCGVAFHARNLPTIPPREAQVARAEKVKVFTQWKYQDNGKTYNASFGQIETDLWNSGCCEVARKASEATLLLTGTTDNIDTIGDFQKILIAGLFATIPTWHTNTVHINVTAFDGEKRNYYSFSDSYTEVVWLPFIFVSPFTSSPDLEGNINRNIIIALKKDGYL